MQNDSPPDPYCVAVTDEGTAMPELQHQCSSGGLLSVASGSGDNSLSGLASSFKDKMKMSEKKISESQSDQKKEVMVEVGSKKKRPGGTGGKKSAPAANLVIHA